MVAGAIGVLIWWTKFRQAVSISRNIKWPRRVTDKKDLIRLYSTREVLEEHKTLFLFVFNDDDDDDDDDDDEFNIISGGLYGLHYKSPLAVAQLTIMRR